MLDGLTVVAEEMRELIGQPIRIESSRYPDDPGIGELDWVGWDPFAGFSAWVRTSVGTVRYIPIAHVQYFETIDLDVRYGLEWECDKCEFSTSSNRAAGEHAEQTAHWLYLFPTNRFDDTLALEEIHDSDAGGWYHSPVRESIWSPGQNSWYRHRARRQRALKGGSVE